ncbi:cytochrome C biogenesis protein CcdA [Amylibacter marinus]|uniref:Cytochrome C biogenesis protein CcdA n=1 Tax=Amylibacter marinus TaxID=1475483 RepID=A0ABQ5VVQ2_9RHOB|nr:cytochrome c biogenesis CcdA family protein [Amylibacter marinus]GLQ35362.1 cytochrome C biogenesis protein CcdA [Amylibacter marinus]
MELIFAYIAGLLTLINPCVLPVLPIVLVTALNADKRGPLALALGMSISFIGFGMFVALFGRAIGLSVDRLSSIGAWVMIVFGLILLIRPLGAIFERGLARFAQNADQQIGNSPTSGLRGQFIGGTLLGAVWSPCIGPTLGGAIALASQGENLFWAFLIMLFFALGVSTLIIGIGMGGQNLIRKRAQKLQGLAEKSKPLMGGVFIAVGVMILTRLHHTIERWAVESLPYWFQDLSVAL